MNTVSSVVDALRAVHSGTSTNAQRMEAQRYLESVKTDAGVAALAVQLLSAGDQDLAARFFGLQLLTGVIRTQWFKLSEAEKQGIKGGLMSLFLGYIETSVGTILNKVIECLTEVAIRDWPVDWPELLEQLPWEKSPRWALTFVARLCELCTAEHVVLPATRKTALIVSVAELLVPRVMAVATTYLASNMTDPAAIQAGVDVFIGLAETVRRSDFLFQAQVDQFILAALMTGTISEDVRFKLLSAQGTMALLLDGRRTPVNLSGAIFSCTQTDVERFLVGVCQLAAEGLGAGTHGRFAASESTRDLHMCLAETFLEVVHGTCSKTAPSAAVVQAGLILARHPSAYVALQGVLTLDFLVKKHRTNLTIYAAEFLHAAISALHSQPLQGRIQEIPSEFGPLLLPGMSSGDHKHRMEHLMAVDSEEWSHNYGRVKTAVISLVRQLKPEVSLLGELLALWLVPAKLGLYSAAITMAEAYLTLEMPGGKAEAQQVHQLLSFVVSKALPNLAVHGEPAMRTYLAFCGSVCRSFTEEDVKQVVNVLFTNDLVASFKSAQNCLLSLSRFCPKKMTTLIPAIRDALVRISGTALRPWAVEALVAIEAASVSGSSESSAWIFSQAQQQLGQAIQARNPGDIHRALTLLGSVIPSGTSGGGSAACAAHFLQSITPIVWDAVLASGLTLTQVEWDSMFGSDEAKKVAFPGGAVDKVESRQWYHCFTVLLGVVAKTAQSNVPEVHDLFPQVVMKLLSTPLPRPSLQEVLLKHALTPIARAIPGLGVTVILPRVLEYALSPASEDAFVQVSVARLRTSVLVLLANVLEVEDVEEILATPFMSSSSRGSSSRSSKRTKNRFAVLAEPSSSAEKSTVVVGVTKEDEHRKILIQVCGLLLGERAREWRQDGALLARILGLIPSVILRCWTGVVQASTMGGGQEYCKQVNEEVIGGVMKLLRELMQKTATTSGRLQDLLADKPGLGAGSSELIEKSTLILQAVFAVNVALFAQEAKVAGVACTVENVGISAVLMELVRRIVEHAGDTEQVRMLVSGVVKEKAGKSSRTGIRQIVMRIAGVSGDESGIVGESEKDKSIIQGRFHMDFTEM